MSALLIAMMVLLYTLQSLLCRKYTDNYPGEKGMASPVFTVVSGLVVSIVSFGFAGFSFSPSLLTIFFGIINAVALVGYNTFIIKASQTGSYSILMVFSIAGGIAIPAFAAGVFFGDSFSLVKFISILIIFASVYMISRKEGETIKGRKTFFIACTGLGISNGAYGALLDAQQRLTGTHEKEEMVAVTFLFAVLISFAMLVAKTAKTEKTAKTAKTALVNATLKNRLNAVSKSFSFQTTRSLFYLIACSITASLAINILVYVLPLVNVTVLYTFDNAGVLLLSVLCSSLFLKEKLSKLNILGCLTMCCALVCVTLF